MIKAYGGVSRNEQNSVLAREASERSNQTTASATLVQPEEEHHQGTLSASTDRDDYCLQSAKMSESCFGRFEDNACSNGKRR